MNDLKKVLDLIVESIQGYHAIAGKMVEHGYSEGDIIDVSSSDILRNTNKLREAAREIDKML